MKNHHRILRIRSSLGSKFHLQQTLCFFKQICYKKDISVQKQSEHHY